MEYGGPKVFRNKLRNELCALDRTEYGVYARYEFVECESSESRGIRAPDKCIYIRIQP